MRLYARWAALGLGFVATLMCPFAGSSCGRSACLTVSQLEIQKNGGACPSAKKALPRFTDPGCGTPVSSVDGPGELDGELCCYPVTEAENMGCFVPIHSVGGGGSCTANGGKCSSNADCCSFVCTANGLCNSSTTSCANDGEPCANDGDCCISLCNFNQVCGPDGCRITGDPCATDSDCCSDFCGPQNQCE